MKCSVDGCVKESKVKKMCSAHYQRFTRYGSTELRGRGAKAKHGMKNTPTYKSWSHMKYRCLNPNSNKFNQYGGRGIKVCDRWMNFEAFLEDMGVRPEGTTIDRIECDGDYEPGNCRWATSKTQGNNKRNNDVLDYKGVKMNLSQWSSATGIPRTTLFNRLYTLGWPLGKSLGYPDVLKLGETVDVPEELIK